MVFEILIVDDEVHVVDTIAFLLKEQLNMDCQVYRATSGQEALRIAESVRPDLLITDMRMPGMTGLELLAEINRLHPDCQAVVLTGFSDFQSAYSAIQMNVAGYLLKTEEDQKIVDTIESVLRIIEERYPRTGVIQDETAEGDDYVVKFVKRYVKEHLSRDLSMSTIAEAAGYNGDYLTRLFKQATGKTIGQYVSEKRIMLIRELLQDDRYSLDDICRLSGFSTRSYFNRFVKMATGMSPRQLRLDLQDRNGGE